MNFVAESIKIRDLPVVLGFMSLLLCHQQAFGQNVPLPNANSNRPLQPGPPPERSSCAIVLVEAGQLRQGVDGMELSSKLAGGRPGVIQVSAKGGRFRLSIDDPVGFRNAPTNGNQDMTLIRSFLGYGATNFAERPGSSSVQLKNGDTTIETHLVAQRISDPFPAGSYDAELTVRCE